MDLKIHAVGGVFDRASELRSVVDLLQNYELIMDKSLNTACITSGVSPGEVDIKMNIARPGTLNVDLIMEVTAAVAPLAPQIFNHAWLYLKAACDLVTIASKHFKESGRPVTIHIDNSPNASVNVNIVGGNQVHTTGSVLDVARSIHPFLDKIAQLIKRNKAETVTLETGMKDYSVIEFNRRNQNDFYIPEADISEDIPIELECEFYRINKKNMNGYLQYDEDEKQIVKPFVLDPELINTALDAFKDTRVKVLAYREIATNALGESKIKRFYIIDITRFTD